MHNEQHLDTLTFSHQLYDEMPRELEFRATTVAEAAEWQRVLHGCVNILSFVCSQIARIL